MSGAYEEHERLSELRLGREHDGVFVVCVHWLLANLGLGDAHVPAGAQTFCQARGNRGKSARSQLTRSAETKRVSPVLARALVISHFVTQRCPATSDRVIRWEGSMSSIPVMRAARLLGDSSEAQTDAVDVHKASAEKRFHGLWLNASPVIYCMYSVLPRVGSSHGVSGICEQCTRNPTEGTQRTACQHGEQNDTATPNIDRLCLV